MQFEKTTNRRQFANRASSLCCVSFHCDIHYLITYCFITMAHAVISGVLEQLRSILQTDQVNLLAGERNESKKLADTLSRIRGVLEDAEEKQVNSGIVKVWLEQLTHISYDADDVVDDWKTEILSSQIQLLGDDDAPVSEKVWSCLFSLFSCLKSAEVRNDFGSKMIDINERLDQIGKDIALLNLIERQSREEPRAVTSSFVDDSEIYGRVDDIYSIVSMLLSETNHPDSHVPLISIVGTGGFGKTTLVQLILKDGQVMNNFEKLMWVCVSKPFDLERVAKSIIKEATGDVPSVVVWQDLHRSLSESVRGKKFLLVLDDIWTYDPDIWRKLKFSLDGGAHGSRIIITTRDENIAKRMASTYKHRLEQLSDEECWSFFKHIALRERQDNRQKFEEIGKQIACKCKGAPLAVKIIASLMCLKGSVREWEDVLANDIWEVMSEDEHGFLPSILLSYDALPSHLKRCFSYCAIFQEDAILYKDELVKLWMAQGFLGYDSSKDLEKIGTGYFNDLAMRSLFQDFEKDGEGDVIRCKMHDIVHDFARHLAKNESSIFMKNDAEVGNIKLRHFRARYEVDTSARLKLFIRQMTCLRVLDLSWTDCEELPDEVDRLLHLRLLDLSYNSEMKTLPETVCNLFNLQTLKLNACNHRKLPEGIGKLVNLRHLELEKTLELSYFPRGLERLSCLRTLSTVILDRDGGKGCQIGELKLLNHIQGELIIKGLGQVADSKQAELKKKDELRSLALDFFSSEEEYEISEEERRRRRIESVLDGLQPHTNLAELNIWSYVGNKFPSWMSSNTALPNLVKLSLISMPEWEGHEDEIKLPIRRDEEEEEGLCLPCLRKLSILFCPKLKVVPHYLFSPALRILHIRDCPQLTGRQPCLPPLLEELILGHDIGILSKSILPPNLHYFHIYWSNESSLPQGFNQLTAIQTLDFYSCKFLDFTPEDLKHLPMLQLLKIEECPILKERCRKRESWITNSHIPKIQLNWRDEFIPE